MGLSRRDWIAAAAAGGALVATRAEAQTPGPATGGESTFERVRRTKVLRVAAFTGAEPYFRKDLATNAWTGAGVKMGEDIAKLFDAKVEYVESSYGNAVLDLQSNKVDLGFAMTPTPRRALSIGFSNPFLMSAYGIIAKKGFSAERWADLNNPKTRLAVELGSVHELAARTFAPNAQILGFKHQPEQMLAVQTGRADCLCIAAFQGLLAAKRNPALGRFIVLDDPVLQLPSCMGIRNELDGSWKNILSAWADYNRGIQQIRVWLLEALAENGVPATDVPKLVTF